MKISCMIVEDEPFAQKGMEEFVREIGFLHLSAVANDALEALNILEKEKIDLLLLDIQMPGLNGLEFLKTLLQPPMVILTTAYPQYALEGYDHNVIDYLVKPIPFDRFVRAANKARAAYCLRYKPVTEDFFFIKTDKKLEKINIADLLYIEALAHYVMLYTKSRKYITHMSFKSIEEKLPSFIKIHKSFLVSIDKIDSIHAESVLIQGRSIPISKNYKSNLMEIVDNKTFKR